MITSLSHRLAFAVLIGCTLVLSSSGCALMSRGNVNSRPLEPGELAEHQQRQDEAEGEAASDGPAIKVSTKGQFSRRKTETVPLEAGMTLQDVLEETRVTRRFRDMEINVMRVTPYSNGMAVPLQAEYDTAKNRVGVLHDMALHPGDHVMIVEEVTSPFDDVIAGMRRRGG